MENFQEKGLKCGASARDNLSSGGCKQERCSLISAFVICLLESIISRLCISENFNFLASLCI